MRAIDFSGQMVIVTGAARGIGEATAKGFADLGASVWMVDADAAALIPAADAAGAFAAVADVSSTAEVERVVAEAGAGYVTGAVLPVDGGIAM